MDSDFNIGWVLAGLFVFVTLVSVVVTALYPEWMGISGKKANEIMKEQNGSGLAGTEKSPTDKTNS
jgi:hypothetical protein